MNPELPAYDPIDPDDIDAPRSPVTGAVEKRAYTPPDFIQQIKDSADKLLRDDAPRGDIKLLNTALKELRYSLKVFAKYRHRRKVTVFGSARTPVDHPSYLQGVECGKRLVDMGYMVITGAGGGIMEAGHVGSGPEEGIGLNIMLPFEQSANRIMLKAGERLMTLKYFFTRKLMFVKETDAVILFPGGFGTMDEAFEVLTLVQTGKSHLFPIICLDHPGGTFWKNWQSFVEKSLFDEKYISPADLALYMVTDSLDSALAEITKFYRVYHSMRYVKNDLMLRLKVPISQELLQSLRHDYRDIVLTGTIEQTKADPSESNEAAIIDLPRLRFRFDRRHLGKLRRMIDRINHETLV